MKKNKKMNTSEDIVENTNETEVEVNTTSVKVEEVKEVKKENNTNGLLGKDLINRILELMIKLGMDIDTGKAIIEGLIEKVGYEELTLATDIDDSSKMRRRIRATLTFKEHKMVDISNVISNANGFTLAMLERKYDDAKTSKDKAVRDDINKFESEIVELFNLAVTGLKIRTEQERAKVVENNGLDLSYVAFDDVDFFKIFELSLANFYDAKSISGFTYNAISQLLHQVQKYEVSLNYLNVALASYKVILYLVAYFVIGFSAIKFNLIDMPTSEEQYVGAVSDLVRENEKGMRLRHEVQLGEFEYFKSLLPTE